MTIDEPRTSESDLGSYRMAHGGLIDTASADEA